MREGRFCATLFRTARKLLILNGEMSEWLKEHAWKLTPAARADAHEIPPTHFRSTTSHNNDVNARVPVNRGVDPGFRGVCDTVLTQNALRFRCFGHRCDRSTSDWRLTAAAAVARTGFKVYSLAAPGDAGASACGDPRRARSSDASSSLTSLGSTGLTM
jgi:hypothetical protein